MAREGVKPAQSGLVSTWWATISTQARETVWWYFCGARSYAAMCRIQLQTLLVASGMP